MFIKLFIRTETTKIPQKSTNQSLINIFPAVGAGLNGSALPAVIERRYDVATYKGRTFVKAEPKIKACARNQQIATALLCPSPTLQLHNDAENHGQC